jgi:hypothetical protein
MVMSAVSREGTILRAPYHAVHQPCYGKIRTGMLLYSMISSGGVALWISQALGNNKVVRG